MNNISKISFMAKPGAEVMRRVRNDCNSDETRINKFQDNFHNTFDENLDENTVVDVDEKEQYVFSHLKFPDIFYKSDRVLDRGRGNDFQSAVIMACPAVLKSVEHKMIRTIIAESVKSGISFDTINKMADSNIKNKEVKKYFLDNINIARRIKEENPESNLTFDEFDEMDMIIFEELAETPGTPEYKMAHGDFSLLPGYE